MPIQSDDIKLLRSAVMADVPEGGGAATGIEVVDGQSNNIFPDTSGDDRASGRFRLRKVFGAAHTDDTDLLLGASFAVLAPPEDPLVHVNFVEVDGWFSERTDATDMIERYLVKGSRLLSRIQDVHYAGALLLQLYNIAPGTSFPEPGDTIVVRNPSGQEQYVRVLKTTLSTAVVILGGAPRDVNLCSCELSNELDFDVLGRAIQLDDPSAVNTAVAYSTTPSVGARFYGVKPLGLAAEIGDRSVTTDGGIFSPIVPAATVEEPIVDVYPLVPRPSLSRTAAAVLALPAQSINLGPGSVLRMPTAAEPTTVAFTHGATAFASNNAGEVLQGTTVVGSVDYRAGLLTMSGTAPSYGTQSLVLSYRPATVVGALAHSASQPITTNNQGLAWVFAFEPPPAPGTLMVSYMAQGRWYTLEEDGTGRLAGADSSYGSGALSFQTGSLALSLGAIPDVGSDIIFLWGDAETAQAATGLPTRAWAAIPPDFELPSAPVVVEGMQWIKRPGYNRVYVSGQGQGVLGRVTRAGTAGDLEAPMVVDALITHADAARQRGLRELSNTGTQAMVSLSLPVLAETGIILPGNFVRYVDGPVQRLGIVRSTSLDWQRPRLRQAITLETHVEA